MHFLDPKFRAAYDELPKVKAWPRDGKLATHARKLHDDPAFRAGDAENILTRKNYEALGSFRREDRPRALDLLGFASQLIFTTWCLGNFGLDETGDLELCLCRRASAQPHDDVVLLGGSPVARHRLRSARRFRARESRPRAKPSISAPRRC